MNLLECIFTKSDCYQTGRTIVPKGVMIHSTGANNPNLKRYVQPDDGLLGVNPNGNHWNRPGVNACVHAFIGRLSDGTVAAVQTLPWNHRGWHAGTGTSGRSANDTHIGFEICEDGLDDEGYFAAAYRTAVELTAVLCEQFGLNPLADGVVICHAEGYGRGIASNHGDVEHWFPKFGRIMDDFRADVAKELEDDMTQETFNKMMSAWLAGLAEQPPSQWSAEARAWAEGTGLIFGDENGEKQYRNFCTREQLMTFLYRFSRLNP